MLARGPQETLDEIVKLRTFISLIVEDLADASFGIKDGLTPREMVQQMQRSVHDLRDVCGRLDGLIDRPLGPV